MLEVVTFISSQPTASCFMSRRAKICFLISNTAISPKKCRKNCLRRTLSVCETNYYGFIVTGTVRTDTADTAVLLGMTKRHLTFTPVEDLREETNFE